MIFGKPKQMIGLDVGSSAVKLVELRDLGRGKGYQLKAWAHVPLSADAIVDGSIMDGGAVIDAIRQAVSAARPSTTQAAIALSGTGVILKRINLPYMSEAALAESIRWEAEQYIPFPIDEVKLDYQLLDAGAPGGSMEVLLVAVKNDRVNDYTSIVGQAGLVPTCVDIDAFCVQNSFEINYPISGSEITALVNLGAHVTNIAILKGDAPLFWRDIPLGGNQYTDALQRELNLTFEVADALKRGEDAAGVSFDQAVPVLNNVTEDLGNEFKKTFDFFKATTSEGPIARIYLSGGPSRVINLDRFLAQRFSCAVEVMNPFRNVEIPDKQFNAQEIEKSAPGFAVAVGLALRKLGD